ncbi:MAG TPA: hypothetical protein VMD09_15955 [Solirubrobacteraceae bacterium]|nr:hypothetical protein [Solirubrobacteraceae bacterium]
MENHDPTEKFPPAPDHPPRQELRALTIQEVEALHRGAVEYLSNLFPDDPPERREKLANRVVEGIQWIAQKWGTNQPCPYCQNPQWEVGLPVQFLVEPFQAEKLASKLAPLHQVTCTNCGNTVFVRAFDPKKP